MESVLQKLKRESGKLVTLKEACERTLGSGRRSFPSILDDSTEMKARPYMPWLTGVREAVVIM